MNNTTKLIIAGGAGLGAFFIYRAIKKAMDEKNAAQEKLTEAEKAKTEAEAAAAAQKAAEAGKKTTYSKPSTGVSNYKKRVMYLQELLQVGVDGDAGEQTLGTLDFYWASAIDAKTPAQRKAGGYQNLVNNGKGVLSPNNIEYYISTLEARNSPRQLIWKGNAESAAKAAADSIYINTRKAWGEARFKDGAAGRAVRLRSGSLAANVYRYDYGLKMWLKTGETYTFTTTSPNHLFATFSKEGYTDGADQKAEDTLQGFYILKNKATGQVVITNPTNFSAF